MKSTHPDKPAEAEEIILAIQKLWSFQQSGRWDMVELDKWLRQYPDQICQAAERLDNLFNNIYPDQEV